MAFKKNATSNEKKYFNLEGMEISKVRQVADNVIMFSLCGNGVGLYNMRVVDGKNGPFIASPQRQGNDGNWYDMFAVYLTDEDKASLIERVLAEVK